MNIIEYGKVVLNQILIMAILIAIGFFITKYKKLSGKAVEDMTFIVFRIVTPCVIINSILTVNFTKDFLYQIIIAAVFAIASHLLGILSGCVFAKTQNINKKCVYKFGCLITNAGFIALPLAQIALDANGVLLVSIYVIILNIFLWTIGKSFFPHEPETGFLNIIMNPGIIGFIGGMLALLVKLIYLPSIFTVTISMISALNTPLAMIITGYYLVNINLKEAILNTKIWYVIFIRQVALPLFTIIITRYVFGISGTLLASVVLPVAAPCGLIVIMFAARYGGDVKTASQMASLSTVLSLITLPLSLMFCKLL